MTDETAIVKADVSLPELGTREDIAAYGRRLKVMLPGGDKLTDEQAMAVAQAAILSGANPFRGEIYGFPDKKGKLVIDEGYKLLVRWAKKEMPYTEWYEPFDAEPAGSIGYRCFILRQDNKELLSTLLKTGVPLERAQIMTTTDAVGVVGKGEMTKRPPQGWTWDQRARIRALKNALKLSHGAPSLTDLAHESWNVNGTQTQPEDWRDVTPQMSKTEREAMAAYNADLRENAENPQPAETVADAVAELYGKQAVENGHFEESPVPVQDNGNGDDGYSFHAVVINAVIKAGYAANPAHASAMLNLSQILTDKDEIDLVLTWAKHYRIARDEDMFTEDAATLADQQLEPIMAGA